MDHEPDTFWPAVAVIAGAFFACMTAIAGTINAYLMAKLHAKQNTTATKLDETTVKVDQVKAINDKQTADLKEVKDIGKKQVAEIKQVKEMGEKQTVEIHEVRETVNGKTTDLKDEIAALKKELRELKAKEGN